MSSNVPGMERHAKTLRAWQLAILRFVVTLDNADRLAVLMIAAELDGVAPVAPISAAVCPSAWKSATRT